MSKPIGTDDLVERLRSSTAFYHADCELKMACADRIEELEAKLAKALELAEEAFDFNIKDDGPRAWHSINDRIEELKGQNDE